MLTRDRLRKLSTPQKFFEDQRSSTKIEKSGSVTNRSDNTASEYQTFFSTLALLFFGFGATLQKASDQNIQNREHSVQFRERDHPTISKSGLVSFWQRFPSSAENIVQLKTWRATMARSKTVFPWTN